MLEKLKETVINRVIGELFIEAEKILKDGIVLAEINATIIAFGLGLSFMGLCHAMLNPLLALGFDAVNAILLASIMSTKGLKKSRLYKNRIEEFMSLFNANNHDIYSILREEFTSDTRFNQFFTKEQLAIILEKGILNLTEQEIELFSKVRFNDNQVKYLQEVIYRKEKINVVNFLDLVMLEASEDNKKFVQLGGKNKTLEEIINPKKTLKTNL